MFFERGTYTADNGTTYRCRIGSEDFIAQPTQAVGGAITGQGHLRLRRNSKGFGLHPRYLNLSYYDPTLPPPEYVYRKRFIVLLQVDYETLINRTNITIGVRNWFIESGVGEAIR